MLDFFPNVMSIRFGSIDMYFTNWENRAGVSPHEFDLTQTAWAEDDGSVTKPTPVWDIANFDYKLTPLSKFDVQPVRDKHGDWLRLLEHRKAVGLPIAVLKWGMGAGEESRVVPRLVQALPPGLRILKLRLGSEGPLSTALDDLMAHIDTKHVPDLRILEIKLLFFQTTATDAEAPASGPRGPRWLANDIPDKLEVRLNLVLLSHSEDEHADEDVMASVLYDVLPLKWIQNAKRKLGPDSWYRLTVRTYWNRGGDEEEQSFSPPAVSAALTTYPPGFGPDSP